MCYRARQLLSTQEGKCAICHREFTRQPHVDHDHRNDRIRGLLCGSCNRAIGLLGDDADRVQSAANYLEAHS
jgi:uncharacterized CHY-type Zn-finger protein